MSKYIAFLFVYLFSIASYGEDVTSKLSKEPIMKWEIRCSKNPITDGKQCDAIHTVNGGYYYHEDEMTLIVWTRGKQQGNAIVVNESIFPNSEIAIRVDKKQPFYFRSNKGIVPNQQVNSLLTQLLNGKTAVVQYHDWPYNSQINREIDLDGLKDAYENMRSSVANTQ